MKILQRLKGVILTLVTRHGSNSKRYWNLRWRMGYDVEKGLEEYRGHWKTQIIKLMKDLNCENILDVGCGKAWLRSLPGYLGSDVSLEVLRRNKLPSFLVADAAEKLPLPNKSFDASVSFCFIMHQRPNKAEVVASEMMRVTKKLIVLKELTEPTGNASLKYHCFKHDYQRLFGNFDGKLEMLEW